MAQSKVPSPTAKRSTSARQIKINVRADFSRKRRNRTKKEKHSGESYRECMCQCAFIFCSLKSFSRRIGHKF